MSERTLTCPECGAVMTLKDSRYGKFYGCVRWPNCDCTHGAHEDGSPKGVPGDKATRQARIRAHAEFDQVWRELKKAGVKGARKKAYRWLRDRLGVGKDECHIALFDEATCERVIQLCQNSKYEFLYNAVPKERE